MVDFTKPINNEQMVAALNKLIGHNQQVVAAYNNSLDEQEIGEAGRLAELRAMHQRHAQMLGDSVRALGGAPDKSGPNASLGDKASSLLSGFGGGSAFSMLNAREEALTEAYVSTVDEYRASDEIVNVVNKVLDNGKPLRDWLRNQAEQN